MEHRRAVEDRPWVNIRENTQGIWGSSGRRSICITTHLRNKIESDLPVLEGVQDDSWSSNNLYIAPVQLPTAFRLFSIRMYRDAGSTFSIGRRELLSRLSVESDAKVDKGWYAMDEVKYYFWLRCASNITKIPCELNALEITETVDSNKLWSEEEEESKA